MFIPILSLMWNKTPESQGSPQPEPGGQPAQPQPEGGSGEGGGAAAGTSDGGSAPGPTAIENNGSYAVGGRELTGRQLADRLALSNQTSRWQSQAQRQESENKKLADENAALKERVASFERNEFVDDWRRAQGLQARTPQYQPPGSTDEPLTPAEGERFPWMEGSPQSPQETPNQPTPPVEVTQREEAMRRIADRMVAGGTPNQSLREQFMPEIREMVRQAMVEEQEAQQYDTLVDGTVNDALGQVAEQFQVPPETLAGVRDQALAAWHTMRQLPDMEDGQQALAMFRDGIQSMMAQAIEVAQGIANAQTEQQLEELNAQVLTSSASPSAGGEETEYQKALREAGNDTEKRRQVIRDEGRRREQMRQKLSR